MVEGIFLALLLLAVTLVAASNGIPLQIWFSSHFPFAFPLAVQFFFLFPARISALAVTRAVSFSFSFLFALLWAFCIGFAGPLVEKIGEHFVVRGPPSRRFRPWAFKLLDIGFFVFSPGCQPLCARPV